MLAGFVRKHSIESETQDDDRLLQLYWNRAELKKELRRLRRERFDLLDQLKSRDGATDRARREFSAVEDLLGHPGSAHRVVLHYRLRHLYRVCARRVRHFARELADRQRDREHRLALARHAAARQQRQDSLRKALADLHAAAEHHEARLGELHARLADLGFWRYRTRRRLKGEVAEAEAELGAVRSRVEELSGALAELGGAASPDPPELSLEARRAINLATIALAQELVARLEDGDLARLAKAAMLQSVQEVEYGERGDCEHLTDMIDGQLDRLERSRRLSARVQRRTRSLREEVEYRSASESVPLASSLDHVVRLADDDGAPRLGGSIRVNVLADDYWELQKALI